MFKSIKEYIQLKAGIKQNAAQLQVLERKLENRYDFLAAFMNLTWPEHLQIDPAVLEKASKRMEEEFGLTGYSTAVHKNDLMFAFHINQHKYDLPQGVFAYFSIGAGIAQNLKKITEGILDTPSKVLDFGSGYGRISRFLPHYFPSSQIEVSEVKKQSMRFQAEKLGFKTILHNQEPESFPQGKYDLILALSVFTHLPRPSFEAWLQKLWNSLNEGGALVFTFRDTASADTRSILERLEMERGDFVYTDRSEEQHFSFVADSIKDHQQYGSTFVSRKYLRGLLEPKCKNIRFLEKDLAKAQDSVLIMK